MADWFRSWHGAPTDPKWRTIAKRAKVAPSLVVAVAWALMDRASQNETRGSIDGIDLETLADFMDCEPGDIERIMVAMREKCVLTGEVFTAWEKRQPKREDGAADRAKEWRDRKAAERAERAARTEAGNERVRTDANATERTRTQENVEERRVDTDTDSSSLRSDDLCPKPGKPVRTRKPYPSDFEAFWTAYPTDSLMSKQDAGKAWSRLSDGDRVAARAGVEAFVRHCQANPTYRPLHAVRYLTQRRFDGDGKAHRDGLTLDGQGQVIEHHHGLAGSGRAPPYGPQAQRPTRGVASALAGLNAVFGRSDDQ